MNKEQAYLKIKQLVDRFNEQLPYYKKADYNETQTRREFIDPFFKALGWDIDNEQGLAEAYKDVIHEYKLKIKQSTKAPDYCFTISGQPKFFVEAKKPSIYIKEDNTPAYQVKRYGWNAKLSISIVTDFEEFAIYDCTKKPNIKDKATLGRIKYLTFSEYLTEFDFLWETFAKERVLRGSFDKFVKSDAAKKGTTTVDYDFLQSMEEWRKYLATSIAINNHSYTEDDINFVVQQTLDRIIFLRICEDRSIEPSGRLKATITTKGTTYHNLFDYFKEADAKYNSGLFDFKKDKLSATVIIDNKVLKTIITELEESPYLFNIIPVEILGYAYEQFLGKVIRITPGHRVKIEEKPEVRKAGGVFYTPKYIVDYIVQNTVGKIIEGKTAEQVSKIKILDPACGSGSFLLGAYEYLLKWHTNFYHKKFPAVGGKAAGRGGKNNPLTPDGNLTSAVKKQILINNIFGVDLDEQAVEVTKLSLLLKCLEGETNASILHQMTMFKERVLPNLDCNIKSGNSLIDTDFYDYQLDFGEERKIKPFNWQKEFPAVFYREVEVEKEDLKALATKAKIHAKKAMEYATELEEKLSFVSEPSAIYLIKPKSGFDIIIGNPPYLNTKRGFAENPTTNSYYKANYLTATGQFDAYALFIEQANKLLNNNGRWGFIIPKPILTNENMKVVRKMILDQGDITNIADFNSPFIDASVEAVSICQSKSVSIQNKIHIYIYKNQTTKIIDQSNYFKNINYSFTLKSSLIINNLLGKIEHQKTILKDIKTILVRGIEAGKKEDSIANTLKNNNYKKFVRGQDVSRYSLNFTDTFIEIDYSNTTKYKKENIYENKKIIIRRVGIDLQATIDCEKFWNLNTIYNLQLHPEISYELITGIFNSKLISFWFKNTFVYEDKIFPYVRVSQLEQIPFPIQNINENCKNQIINFVTQLLQLNKDLLIQNLDSQRQQIHSKINYCDDKINELVYNLYQLCKEEVILIENSL